MDFSLFQNSSSIQPKYTHYAPDGHGRDTYVIANNGGLLSMAGAKIPHTGYQQKSVPTQFFVNQQQHNYSFSPRKEPTSLRYYGDGSGRDGYVIQDFGGLVKTYGNPDTLGNFYKTLRQSPKNYDQTGFGGTAGLFKKNKWLTPKAREIVKQCFMNQKDASLRLSTPKYVDVRGSQNFIDKAEKLKVQRERFNGSPMHQTEPNSNLNTNRDRLKSSNQLNRSVQLETTDRKANQSLNLMDNALAQNSRLGMVLRYQNLKGGQSSGSGGITQNSNHQMSIEKPKIKSDTEQINESLQKHFAKTHKSINPINSYNTQQNFNKSFDVRQQQPLKLLSQDINLQQYNQRKLITRQQGKRQQQTEQIVKEPPIMVFTPQEERLQRTIDNTSPRYNPIYKDKYNFSNEKQHQSQASTQLSIQSNQGIISKNVKQPHRTIQNATTADNRREKLRDIIKNISNNNQMVQTISIQKNSYNEKLKDKSSLLELSRTNDRKQNQSVLVYNSNDKMIDLDQSPSPVKKERKVVKGVGVSPRDRAGIFSTNGIDNGLSKSIML
ncbi:UNKNOWN [Stylonychia lemnae]|uniref:Uncharacterized protein n=1 Tax=Stylonychia lemnae TaxID=5949 RepID=A0A077ZVU2_STYLE|nr:UNKNOWN [Stylonychia lemnae]|eukprot:CDW73721.1 UNKNOWN [Stylonychia lemnae]